MTVSPGSARSSSDGYVASPNEPEAVGSTPPTTEYSANKNFRMKNESASVCYQCDSPFSVLNRRKHCFACGQIFCGKCTRRTESSSLKLPKPTTKLIVRVCLFCYDTLHVAKPDPVVKQQTQAIPTPGGGAMLRSNRSSTNLSTAAGIGILDNGHLDLDASDEDEALNGPADEEEELLSKTYKRISIRNLQALMGSSRSDFDDFAQLSAATASTSTNSALPSPKSDSSLVEKADSSATLSAATGNDSSDSDSSSDEGFDDLGREQLEEDTFNKWFSRPVAQQDLDSEIDDPLRSDTPIAPVLKTPTRLSLNLGPGGPAISALSANKRVSIQGGRPSGDLSHSDSLRRLHHKSLSRPHFAVDSSIALPTTPEVKHVRVHSHSLLSSAQETRDEDSQISVHESAFRTLSVSHLEHICELLIDKFGLEKRWKSKIVAFADQTVSNLKIRVKKGDHMDILQYAKVKVIPGGSLDECQYVEGFVFDGQRTKRQMKSSMTNARVLLLGCSLEYERRENVMLSIDKVLQQEREYLSLLVAKVASVNPNIIFVEKNVSLVAQQMLADKGICLLVNVKPRTLQVISRLTGATILQSTDHVSPATVGKCPQFSIDSYSGPWGQKSCVTVRGQLAELYGTVVLRGAPEPILQSLKEALQFLIYSAYNMVLENHVLFEQTATTLDDAHSLLRVKAAMLASHIDSAGPSPNSTPSSRHRAGSDAIDPLQSKRYVEKLFSPSTGRTTVSSTDDSSDRKQGRLEYQGKLISTSWSVSIPKEEKLAKNANARDTVYHVCPSILLPPVHAELKQTCECRLENGTYEVPAPPGPSINFSYRSLLVPNEQLCSDPDIPVLPSPPKSTRPTMAYNQINHLRKKRIHGFKSFSPQHLIYLHSLYSPATNMQCLPYTPQIIHFYSSNDMTLGQFLENFCFNDRSRCRNEECHRPTSEHERCILHAEGRINIAVRPFDVTKALFSHHSMDKAGVGSEKAEFDPSKILMWANCKNLQRQTPYMVPMSRKTWNFSLGKFFELIFYSAHTRCRTCNEPLYRGHVRYFYYNSKVVMFEYEAVKSFETSIPPMQVSLDHTFARTLMTQEIDEVVKFSERMYEAVLGKIVDLEDASTKLDDEEELRSVTIMHRSLEEEKVQFMELVEKERHAVDHVPATTIFQVTRLRRLFYYNIRRWNETVGAEEARIQKKWKSFVATLKEKEKTDAKEREKLEKQERDAQAAKRAQITAASFRDAITGTSVGTTGPETTFKALTGLDAAAADAREEAPRSTGSRQSGGPHSARSRAGSVDEAGTRSRSHSTSSTSSASTSQKLAALSLATGPSHTLAVSGGVSASPNANFGSGRLAPIAEVQAGTSSSPSASTPTQREHAGQNTLTIPIVRPLGSSSQEILFDQIGSPPPAALLVVPQLNYTPHTLLKASTSSLASASTTSAHSSLKSEDLDGLSADIDPLAPTQQVYAQGAESQKLGETEPGSGKRPVDQSKGISIPSSSGSTPDPLSAHPLHLSSSLPRESSYMQAQAVSASPSQHSTSPLITMAFGGARDSTKLNEPTSRIREALSTIIPQKKSQIIDMMNDIEIYVFHPNSNTEPAVAIYENEPSSIIAYSLMSDQYRDKMLKFDHVPPGTLSSASMASQSSSTPMTSPQELRAHILTAAATSTTITPVIAPIPHSIVPTPHSTLIEPQPLGQTAPQASFSGMPAMSTITPLVVGHNALATPPIVISPPPASATPTPVELDTPQGEAIVSLSNMSDRRALVDSGAKIEKIDSSPNTSRNTIEESGSSLASAAILTESERSSAAPSPVIANPATGSGFGVVLPKSISLETNARFEMNPTMEAAYRGLVSPEPTHIDLEWKHTPIWGGPRIQMQCKTYFARQFAWLRSLIGLDEKVFAQSLSRCKPWKARGGKSNSRFARTLDERFILKQVQGVELDGFLAFAPIYFDYFSKVYFQQVPTAICKIVGIFSVTISRKGKSPVKVDLIVQENLFYGHHISKVFDLKGSLRSRYARPESPDDKDVVFMDENLLEMMYGEPICVSNEAKAMLAMTVWNDTLCLSSLNVMDYSLLVGVDDTNGKLVLGIIDYMRTYTWDKQLETWVKRSGILGGAGFSKSKIPTIISPKQYKKRFRLAIWAYFLLIPNLNTKLIYEFIANTAANDRLSSTITKP